MVVLMANNVSKIGDEYNNAPGNKPIRAIETMRSVLQREA